MKDNSDVWVVIPAYNETHTLFSVLDELAKLHCNIIVVDDGSSDGTALQALRQPVVLLRHVCNLGQGAALQTGITFALSYPSAQFIVTMDADGQHSTEDIPRLLDPLRVGTHDVALGSRFLGGVRAPNIKTSRRLLLQMAVLFTRLTTGMALTDTHNGLRAFTAEAAAKICITQNRMAHSSEILSQVASLKLRWCEIPVTVKYTQYSVVKGQPSLNSVNILWDMIAGRMR